MSSARRVSRREVVVGLIGASLASRSLGARAIEGACVLTNEDSLGPFYVPEAPFRSVIAGPDEPGLRTTISGTVRAEGCGSTLPNAVLDIWHCDANGEYHSEKEQFRLRGKVRSGSGGTYSFESIKPVPYRTGFIGYLLNRWRPAHYHYIVSCPGYESLTTELYFKGDKYLGARDGCGSSCHSDDPSRIIELVASQESGRPMLLGSFDIVLKKSVKA